jgi:hypothetical protein
MSFRFPEAIDEKQFDGHVAGFINPAIKFPGFVIPAKAGIHYSRLAPAFAGATIFKGRLNSRDLPDHSHFNLPCYVIAAGVAAKLA